MIAKTNGITKEEIVETITHAAFYAGWPKALWDEETLVDDSKIAHANSMIFPVGEPNNAFAKYFVEQSYLANISKEQVLIVNVTFEPGCRNNWHVYKAPKGGGQVLVCVADQGYYHVWEKEVRKLYSGDVVNIPANFKHRHGATKNSWFFHLAKKHLQKMVHNEWLEAADDKVYYKLK